MTTDAEPPPMRDDSFIIARIVSGLWQGQDQFVVFDAELIRAYGDTSAAPVLRELGAGWGAARKDEWGETTFILFIPTKKALEQLGF